MVDFFKHLALASYFGLMMTLICWIILGEHSENYPTATFLLIALVPLLFPLRGLLHGRPYTYAWTTFLMLLYFAHGIGEFYSAKDFNLYPILEILFSFIMFASSLTFIKLNARMNTPSQKK